MFGITPFILLVLPIIFQIYAGRKTFVVAYGYTFTVIGLLSFLLQFIMSYLALIIAENNFDDSRDGRPYHCGMIFIGLYATVVMMFLVLFLVILGQYFFRRYFKNKTPK